MLAALSVVLVPQSIGFNYNLWSNSLDDYFDKYYILSGISDGFDIGWIDGTEPTYVHNPTIQTSDVDKLDILNWVLKRHASGILLGPFTDQNCPFKNLHFSPLFTVLKPDLVQRVVAHLSYPKWGTSVNDCIEESAKHVEYIYFVEVAQFVYSLGFNAKLWVLDAKDAYYRVPVKEKYWRYMAIKWMGLIFVFTSLQMGLGSACAIYQRFADAILYIIRHRSGELFICLSGGYYIHHYLDDFFGGHSDELTAWNQLVCATRWFYDLGIPTQLKKLKFPHVWQIILGWLYDTRTLTVSLPPAKVTAYTAHIIKIIRERQKGANKKQLERINGELQHAAVAVYPGKAKLRNIQHAMHLELYNYSDKIILSDAVINDLKWWVFALKHMNGIPLKWVISDSTEFHEEIWTDAALKGDMKVGGMGGCTLSNFAYQINNDETIMSEVSKLRKGIDIKLLELIAVYCFVAVLAPNLQYKNIKIWCDNDTAVWALIKKRAPLIRRDMNFVVNKFCELSVQYHFRFWIEHIKGDDNVMADNLSRFKELYKTDQIDPTKFTFVDKSEVLKVLNDTFNEMRNFKRVPRNDDDPLKN